MRRTGSPRWVLALCGLLLALWGEQSVAREIVRTTAETKALYTKHIADYTKWPRELAPDETFYMCSVGHDPNGVVELLREGAESSALTIKGRPVTVVTLPAGDAEALQSGLATCSLLFLTEDTRDDWPELRELVRTRPIMTVAEWDGFAAQHGSVEYAYDGRERTMYMIFNTQAIKQSNLVVSAALLDLRISRPFVPGTEAQP